MSSIARWTYTNTATIKPFLSLDDWTGVATYGEPYTIACTWTAVDLQERGASGHELILKHEVYTEDGRPKQQDMIQLNGHVEWEEIRSKTSWDMSPFSDTPDYKLITG